MTASMTASMETREEWSEPKKILVILAHPDDPEFFCGATIARWTSTGHVVKYALLTKGDKGSNDRNQDPDGLAEVRTVEQSAAAAVLGVHSVQFLAHKDGYLIPNLEMRREIVRLIRQEKPDVVVSSDPLNLFAGGTRINHPDHRAAGQVVLDAVFPAAGNYHFFPELLEEGLEPHSVKEVWLSIPDQANVTIDITDFWHKKIEALHKHQSQIGEVKPFDQRMNSRHTADSSDEAPRYEERFKRLILG
jgi:LmbE family N-acetylglucosaminyl deacetylase